MNAIEKLLSENICKYSNLGQLYRSYNRSANSIVVKELEKYKIHLIQKNKKGSENSITLKASSSIVLRHDSHEQHTKDYFSKIFGHHDYSIVLSQPITLLSIYCLKKFCTDKSISDQRLLTFMCFLNYRFFNCNGKEYTLLHTDRFDFSQLNIEIKELSNQAILIINDNDLPMDFRINLIVDCLNLFNYQNNEYASEAARIIENIDFFKLKLALKNTINKQDEFVELITLAIKPYISCENIVLKNNTSPYIKDYILSYYKSGELDCNIGGSIKFKNILQNALIKGLKKIQEMATHIDNRFSFINDYYNSDSLWKKTIALTIATPFILIIFYPILAKKF